MIWIPCPHFDLAIVSRANGGSAVGKAAYQSGEQLYSERDHETKTGKHVERIVSTEIMLPEHVPRQFADRQLLWNSVEAAEKQWNAQLCRRLILTLPRELSLEDNQQLLRQYCQEQFVSKGMIADVALHDDHDGNPHAHVLLTMRPMDENGQWLPKARKVYHLDENGERIRLKSGQWKSHKERTTDWDDPDNCEKWRHAWEVLQNRYLEQAGRTERVDLRSFARQGNDLIPTVHLGPAASAMERKGVQTFLGDMNREIKALNRIILQIKAAVRDLRQSVENYFESHREAERQVSESLDALLADFFESRSREREVWNSGRAKVKAMSKDFALINDLHHFIHEQGLYSVHDLLARLEVLENENRHACDSIASAEKRKEQIARIIEAGEIVEHLWPVRHEWFSLHFASQRKIFEAEHSDELKRYNRAYAILMNENHGVTEIDPYDFYHEQQQIAESIDDAAGQLEAMKEELRELRRMRFVVSKIRPDLLPEKSRSLQDALAEAKYEIDSHKQQDGPSANRQEPSKKKQQTRKELTNER